ncbi:hypothetical protein EDD73_11110 [Heliophilum fasciatum]|uniref:Transposase n=1 Tax=Heliophilum fasciatum TaxID=35700 RepID=A0A4R2RMI7_9FIRM|nr:transposase InsO family protein [Heliophilum fasciatum]TCP64158.1 hypothetical protein EDD73_11110 [Heliophilum fasciatum]
MQDHGIRSIRCRKYKATTNSNHNLPVAENLLKQDFHVDAPNTVWVYDISYMTTTLTNTVIRISIFSPYHLIHYASVGLDDLHDLS